MRTACRTSSGWRTASRRRPTIRSAATTARSCSSAARRTGPLFDAFFAAVQEAGYPLTDDVNGYRQEGFAAFDRNVHNGRRLSAARAYLHPVMGRPNLDVSTRSFVDADRVRGRRAPSASSTPGGAARQPSGPRRRGDPLRRRDQLAAAAPALRHRRGGRAARARDRRRRRRARRRREPAGPPRGLRPARRHAAGHDGAVLRDEARARRSGSSGCCARPARARRTTSRPAASCAPTTTSPTRT